jgi:hypothetical protein
VGGGNDARYRFLAALPGVKLVGRAALSGQDLGMIEAILEDRKSSPPLDDQHSATQHVSVMPNLTEFKPSSEVIFSQRQRPTSSSLKEY